MGDRGREKFLEDPGKMFFNLESNPKNYYIYYFQEGNYVTEKAWALQSNWVHFLTVPLIAV